MKLNLSQSKGFTNHRSGWSYCLDSLRSYHSNSGLFVNDFIERAFSWELNDFYNGANSNKIPYRFPWVGFLHNPPNMPRWFDWMHSPQAIFKREEFLQSLERCKALIVLSDYLAEWVRFETNIPIISVKHPTGIANQWSEYKFLKSDKQVVQVGYWLRDIEKIAELTVPNNYRKLCSPSNRASFDFLIRQGEVKSEISYAQKRNMWSSVKILDYLPAEDYDEMYSKSVVFLWLYDSSANNAIVEAIARSTPIIVNRHPAVIEYLGPDYPLYCDSLKDVYRILSNTEEILQAHRYLKSMDKHWISGNYFAHDVVNKLKEVL